MTLTLLLVFISAFFTDIIGIHAIFGEWYEKCADDVLIVRPGGFLAGLIIPHENGFSIAPVEKLEDVVSLLLLPLVRTLLGFRSPC